MKSQGHRFGPPAVASFPATLMVTAKANTTITADGNSLLKIFIADTSFFELIFKRFISTNTSDGIVLWHHLFYGRGGRLPGDRPLGGSGDISVPDDARRRKGHKNKMLHHRGGPDQIDHA